MRETRKKLKKMRRHSGPSLRGRERRGPVVVLFITFFTQTCIIIIIMVIIMVIIGATNADHTAIELNAS